MTRRVILALVLTLAPTALWACVLPDDGEAYVMQPPTFGADCSFNVPGPVTAATETVGSAAVNMGGGLIGQRITKRLGCGWDEEIWIVDCNADEMIGIMGVPVAELNMNRRADLLYPPAGSLRLLTTNTVPDIAVMAARAGYDHWTDFSARLAQISGQTPPDPTCGCRIFYPDSAGATQ